MAVNLSVKVIACMWVFLFDTCFYVVFKLIVFESTKNVKCIKIKPFKEERCRQTVLYKAIFAKNNEIWVMS